MNNEKNWTTTRGISPVVDPIQRVEGPLQGTSPWHNARRLPSLLLSAARVVFDSHRDSTPTEQHRALRHLLYDHASAHGYSEAMLDAALLMAQARAAAIRHGEWTRAAHRPSEHRDTFLELASECRKRVASCIARANTLLASDPCTMGVRP